MQSLFKQSLGTLRDTNICLKNGMMLKKMKNVEKNVGCPRKSKWWFGFLHIPHEAYTSKKFQSLPQDIYTITKLVFTCALFRDDILLKLSIHNFFCVCMLIYIQVRYANNRFSNSPAALTSTLDPSKHFSL